MLVAIWPLGRRPERSTASTVTAVSPSFCAASIDAGAAAALVFHLVAQIGDRLARAFDRNFLLQACGEAFIGWRDPGLDLADLDQGNAEACLAPAG